MFCASLSALSCGILYCICMPNYLYWHFIVKKYTAAVYWSRALGRGKWLIGIIYRTEMFFAQQICHISLVLGIQKYTISILTFNDFTFLYTSKYV